MFKAIASPYLVSFDGRFQREGAATEAPDSSLNKKDYNRLLGELPIELNDLQRILYAEERFAVLLIFQGMDAAGKDSTIRAVMNGVDPAGCEAYSFKQPSNLDLTESGLMTGINRFKAEPVMSMGRPVG